MKRCKKNALCCGAGGAQMFKESEAGIKEINHERSEEVNSSWSIYCCRLLVLSVM
jgi:Fe-S oxidoreductase